MVDHIRQARHIDAIRPPGSLRTVKRRQQRKKDNNEKGGKDAQTTEEESQASQNQSRDEENGVPSPSDEFHQNRTGRRIDVRV